MAVKCFYVRDSGFEWRSLRRYWDAQPGDGCHRPDGYGCHNAKTAIGKFSYTREPDGCVKHYGEHYDPDTFKGDPRWPAHCTKCGAPVPENAERQIFAETIYLDDAGAEHSIRTPTPGMMWDAPWAPDCWKGADGLSLHVCCPDGWTWCIDRQASNCTMKDDVGPAATHHRCWVRHGAPPLITVDKAGHTCAAGGGSIQTPTWHGFLRNGELVE